MIKSIITLLVVLAVIVAGTAVTQSQSLSRWVSAVENNSNHGWNLRARTLGDLSFPVPTFQPIQPNRVIALDLHPSGVNVPESPGNGWAWVDACNSDVMHSNANPIGCGRVGIKTISGAPAGYAGYVTYNGAPAGNFYIETGTQARWGWNSAGHYYPVTDNAYQIGSGANRVRDLYLSGGSYGNPYAANDNSLTKTILALQARITALEAVQ